VSPSAQSIHDRPLAIGSRVPPKVVSVVLALLLVVLPLVVADTSNRVVHVYGSGSLSAGHGSWVQYRVIGRGTVKNTACKLGTGSNVKVQNFHT
jgi:hypothetical protein